jgi:integrase
VPLVSLKGINRVRTRLAGGKVATYYYAWKGGPRLPGKPGDPEFIAAFNAAIADRAPSAQSTLAGLVHLYKSKPEYLNLAASTRKEWSRWLDRIVAHDIGSLTLRALEDRRVRTDMMEWRDEFADRPRAADYGVQVLSRVLNFAVDRGLLKANHALGIAQIYSANRAHQIWEQGELAAFCKAASAPVSRALRLACFTGLRRGDLVDLRWGQVSDLYIERETNKSGRRTVALIPIIQDARAVLDEVGRREPLEHVLLNSWGKPWTATGLTHQIVDVNNRLGLAKRLHDARGTFATRLRLAGLSSTQISDVMGWKSSRVEQILARYVDREAIIADMAAKLHGGRS